MVLAEIINGEPRRLVGGSSSEDIKPCSYQRQKLYKTESLMNTIYTSYKGHIGREEHNEVKYVARRITKWLVNVPTNVEDWSHHAGFCFKCEVQSDEDRNRSRDFKIAQLLFRSPHLLQEKTGESTNSAPIFRKSQREGSPMSWELREY